MTPAKMVMAALMLPVLVLVALVAVVAAIMGCAKRRIRVRSTAERGRRREGGEGVQDAREVGTHR